MRDGIDVRRVVRIGLAGLSVLVVVVAAAMWLTSRWDNARPAATETPPTAWIDGPLLETQPQADMAKYLADKRKLLDGYAWVDRTQGIARVPLDLAMRAIEKGARP